MKVVTFAAIAVVLLLCSPSARAAAPELETGVLIQDGTGPLSVNYHSATTVADWNNDGKKDLIVSQFYYGWVWLFINQGTNSAPVFNGGATIESGGSPITTSYG